MNTFASVIDLFLYACVALTVAVIAAKWVDLYWRQPMLGGTEAELQERLEHLEKGLTILAVMGAAAPFIGLMGTVMHIIEALRQLSAGAADMSLVGGPIATALKTTLVGLFAAVPAVCANAFFSRRVELLESRHRRVLQGAEKYI